MHVRRANYQAAIWRRALHPGSSLPGPHGYGWLCKPECGDDPTSHSSVEMQWVIRPAAQQASLDLVKCGCTSGCSTQRCRCHNCKGHFAFRTEMKFVSAQTARISHTSKHHSLHTMTKRLMVTHDLILHHFVVLYFFNSSAGKSQLIIPLYSIITCSTTFNHVFIHLYINLYIITCQSSASSHIIILSCNMVSRQAEILPASVSSSTPEKSPCTRSITTMYSS